METNEKIIPIIGITEAIKQYGIPSQFSPTIAIVIGALLSYAEKPNSQGILEGIILGATVTGVGQGVISPFAKKSSYSNLEPDDYRGV